MDVLEIFQEFIQKQVTMIHKNGLKNTLLHRRLIFAVTQQAKLQMNFLMMLLMIFKWKTLGLNAFEAEFVY